MKRFFRTTAGKTALFIVCILSFCAVAASAAGAWLMVIDDSYNFYTNSEENIQSRAEEQLIRSRLDDLSRMAAEGKVPEPAVFAYQESEVIFRITDSGGKVLIQSPSAAAAGDFDREYIFTAVVEDAPVTLRVSADIAEGSNLEAQCAAAAGLIHTGYALRYWIYAIAAASLLLGVCSFIALMSVSARRPDTEELVPGPLNRLPFDVLALAAGGACVFSVWAGVEIARDAFDSEAFGVMTVIASFIVCACLVLGLCMSAAARIKQKTLISNTLIRRCLSLIWTVLCRTLSFILRMLKGLLRLIRGVPLVWRTAAILSGIALLELVCVASDWEMGIVLLIMINAAVILAGIYAALCLRKLQKGALALASGDLSHITDTKGMIWDFKRSGEDLNSISAGMAAAVEERLKSERMKTELITNVSHDIKTPLTSLINYAGLIAAEPCENEKHAEYSEVLVRQSERLKRLLEDLVEASRASTGDLEVDLMPCDASVFISQAAGEYEDRLKAAGLTLMTKVPQEPVRIMADGRRMQRVFDNLMNNICKYSQSGTRVYLSLEKQGNEAAVSFKNTSRDALDLTEEELTERFTRGDHSRGTEGSGLGLSIAKSLAELQGGALRLSVDGDLFKAVLSFPVV